MPFVSTEPKVERMVALTVVLAGVVISLARVYGSDDTVAADPTGVRVIGVEPEFIPTVVESEIWLALALPAVRAVTAAGATKIFFIAI